MFRKENEYKKAVALRKEGLVYAEIHQRISVGMGTISRWCANIKLTEEQKLKFEQKKRESNLIKNKIRNKKQNQILAQEWAKETVQDAEKRDLAFAGAMLYWAEGTKLNEKTYRQETTFTNTDAKMIQIMMIFLRKILGVAESKIIIRIRIGKEAKTEAAEEFWSQVIGISRGKFKKPEIINLSEKSKSLEKYPNGICRISVYDIFVSRKINSLIEIFSAEMLL